jgi:hypothetical protein
MRRPYSHVLLALLAWCIGFQPVALALGTRCMHGSETEQVAAMPGDAHAMHAMHQMHDISGHEGHGQHASGDSDATGDPKAGAQGCECGCNCAMPGCLGSAPALGPMSSSPLISDSSSDHATPESLSRLRAAHGLDLIRPPSKS